MGVQILRAVSAGRLVAADIDEAKLEFARKHGAVAIVNTRSENAAEEILAVSGSLKVKAVFDFVCIQSTIDLCSACARLRQPPSHRRAGWWGDVFSSGYCGGVRSMGLFGNCALWRHALGLDRSDRFG